MAYGTVNADVIGTSVAGSNLGAGNATNFKNRIINGAMVLDQRNAGASVTITNTGNFTYTLDRWNAYGTQASKFSVQQTPSATETGYATRVAAGFTNYMAATSLSAYTVGTSESFLLAQFIEGLNVADFAWGTASAKTVTLSAWVYSSLTGTFGGSIQNSAQSYSYPFTYSIPVANTWTQISVTISGPTAGTWLTTNGIGVRIWFSLGAGATVSGTAGTWAASGAVSATGATSVVGTSGATFYITGVQLEVGSSATGFEYRDYGRELILCQRYYVKGLFSYSVFATGTTDIFFSLAYPVALRTTPTVSQSSTLQLYDGTANYVQSSVPALGYAVSNTLGGTFGVSNFTGLTTFRPAVLNLNGSTGVLIASAEL